jgi:ATP-dependent DNA helicase PIF1
MAAAAAATPANYGARWTTEQEQWMLAAVAKGQTVSAIAEKMNRTHGSIVSRLCQIACVALEKKTVGSIEEACTMTGMKAEDVVEAQKRRHEREVAMAEKKMQKLAIVSKASSSVGEGKVDIALLNIDYASELNEEQRVVLNKIKEGKNVFLTGGAGAGKSFTLKYIVNWAKAAGKHIGVCAMTGCAAKLIDGTTLHSFMGILPGYVSRGAVDAAQRMKSNAKIIGKLLSLDVLIVDEVSMMNDVFLDLLFEVLSIVRDRKGEPFGGVQVVFVGDMLQLQPVDGGYCFQAKCWDAAGFEVYLLKTNMRQREDNAFRELLDRVRWGKCSAADFKTLSGLKDTVFPEGIVPTRLYSKNADVDRVNALAFAKLVSETGTTVVEFAIKLKGDSAKRCYSKKFAESMHIPASVKMCVGAQVILTRNMDIEAGLINGSRGIVTSVSPKGVSVRFGRGCSGSSVMIDYYTYKNVDDYMQSSIEFSYIPLKLAWGMSIHSSQGMTIDALEIDLGESIFACGQAYTGLSRARDMKSVRVVDVIPTAFKTNLAVVEFYSKYV